MDFSIISISSSSYKNLWGDRSLVPRRKDCQGKGFIFSTARPDPAPFVVIDLSESAQKISDGVLIVRNRTDAGADCCVRVVGLKIMTSSDLLTWRPHDICPDDGFIYHGAGIEIVLAPGERFIKFSREGPNQDHFHLSSIELSPKAGRTLLIEQEFSRFAGKMGCLSNSQRLQDIFAIFVNGFAKNYFLEFGIADGIQLSNTLLLEILGWDGLCGEALESYYAKASAIRRCKIEHCALAEVSGESLEFFSAGLVSSFSKTADLDLHAESRRKGELVSVKTKRLDELLLANNSPDVIGFFSLDIEGAELEVLRTFPFNRYKFNCLAIEHNHTSQEGSIHDILLANGYFRVLSAVSGHDSFYIRSDFELFDWNEAGLYRIKAHSTAQSILSSLSKIGT